MERVDASNRWPINWALVRDAAWLVILTVVGLASILIDASVGSPALLELVAGRAM